MTWFVALLRNCLSGLIQQQASRADLIALDSPFLAESAKKESEDADFKAAWDSMESVNVRGWCEASLDMIVRLLQSLQYRMRVIATDQPPFEGACGSCADPLLTHLDYSCRRAQGPCAGPITPAVCNSSTAGGGGRELSMAPTL